MTRTGSAMTDTKLQGLRRNTSGGRPAAASELARTHSAPLSSPAPPASRFRRSAEMSPGVAPRFGSHGRAPPRSGLGISSSGTASPLSTASSASFASSWPPGTLCEPCCFWGAPLAGSAAFQA